MFKFGLLNTFIKTLIPITKIKQIHVFIRHMKYTTCVCDIIYILFCLTCKNICWWKLELEEPLFYVCFAAHVHYVPGRDREQSYQLELILRLPKKSITRLSIEFERALLKWTEYPPDANHGFYVNSAVISAVLPSAHKYTSTPSHSSRIQTV